MQVSEKGNSNSWISATATAKKLNVATSTLALWREKNKGPKYRKRGGRIEYDSNSVSNYAGRGIQSNYFAEPSKVRLNWKAPQSAG